MAERFFIESIKCLVASVVVIVSLAGAWATSAQAQGKSSPIKIRLATPSASLSYLPIHVALQRGFFARRGFDIEVIQMAAGLVAPALLNRAVDYTTIPSGPATAGARGAPLKVICFTSVKLQHVLVGRPEIMAVSDLAGKRIGAGSFGTLPAYEVRVLIEKYHLGPNTVIVPLNSTNDRMIAAQRGTIDATKGECIICFQSITLWASFHLLIGPLLSVLTNHSNGDRHGANRAPAPTGVLL